MDLGKRINEEKLEKIFKNINCLIHVGAYVPKINEKKTIKYINKVNITSSASLASWSIKKKIQFIYISGAAVYRQWLKNSENSVKLKTQKIFI